MTNVDITDSKIAHKSKKKSRTQALTKSLLRDRAERALASPYPFFDPQHGPNTNVVLRAPRCTEARAGQT